MPLAGSILNTFSQELQVCCFVFQVKAYRGEDLVGTEKIKYQTDKNFRSPVGGRLEITYNTFGLMPRRGFRANYVAGNLEIPAIFQ